MDFATLKAYMISTSIKENLNTTTACVQKRLNVNNLERKTNRNSRLTQFRKIPENMSACNTPQGIRTVLPLDITKASINNAASKLYEDKQKMRLQRLREFKEKRDKLKREEAATKKPLFKVTHTSVEKYDLNKIYNNIKGMPILPNKESYKFSAPKNVHAISVFKNTTMKAQGSPRRHFTRSTTRLHSNTLNEVVNRETPVNQNATLQSKLNRNASKHAFVDGRSKDLHQKLNSPRKPHKNQSTSQFIDNTDIAPRNPVKTSKSRLQTTKPKEISSRTNLFEIPKDVIKTPEAGASIANPETTMSNSNLAFEDERSKRMIRTSFKASVKITRAEQMLTDSILPSSIFEELHTSSGKNKAADAEEKYITKQSTKIPVKTPSKVKVNQPISSARKHKNDGTPAKTNAKLNVKDGVSDILVETPSKMDTNLLDIAKTPKFVRKSKLEEIQKHSSLKNKNFVQKSTSTINDDETTSKKMKMERTPRTNYNSNIEEVLGEEKYLKTKVNRTKSLDKLKTKTSPKRRLRSKSTAVLEEQVVKPLLKSKKIKSRITGNVEKSTSKPNTDTRPEIDAHFPNTSSKSMVKTPAKKTLLKKSESQSIDVIEDSVVINIENNVNEANTAKQTAFVKTPENTNLPEKINSFKTPTATGEPSGTKTSTGRRLRSKSTDIHKEEEVIKSSSKSKKIKSRITGDVEKSTSKPNADTKPEIDSQFPNTSSKSMVKTPAKKTLLKKLKGQSIDVIEDSGVINIENNVNEANTAKRTSFVKTPENTNLPEKINSFKTPTDSGEPGRSCIYISPFVTVSRGKQRARDEYTQRQNSGGTINSPALQQSTSVKTAAEFFTLLLNKETAKINKNCDYWNTFKNENNLPEEAVDMIDVATGQGTLLKNKKMETFRNLIQYSLEEQTDKPVTCMDLHGYWDVLNMQIDNVSTRFENLLKLRDNNWTEILPEKPKKITAAKKVSKPLANTKRSNALREAIKSARLRSKTQSSEISSDDNIKTPKSDGKSKKNRSSSAKGSHKRISALSNTPRKSISSPRSSSPHIMMQVSQVAKSVDRLGSEAVQSAKSILKKRQSFKASGRKPKIVLFDVSDDVIEDYVSAQDNDDITRNESPFVRRSTRLQ